MTIRISPDSLDWSKAYHMRNVAATNKLLALLHEHHGNGELVTTAPIEASEPEPEPVIAAEPEPAPEPIIKYGPGHYVHIQRVVAKHYGITRVELLGPSHRQKYSLPRQVAMYLCHVNGTRTLPEIGRRFGGRDHTTVLHAVRKIERWVEQDLFDMPATIAKLREALGR